MALVYQADTDLERYAQYPDLAIREKHHLYCKDKYAEALACFEKAIELNPTLPIPWAHRGFALWCLSDGYDSLEYYKMIKDYYKKARDLPHRVDGCLFVERAEDVECYVDYKITELQSK